MPVSSLPTTKDIEPVILDILSNGKTYKLREIYAKCAEHFNLSYQDLSETVNSGDPRFYKRCRWGIQNLKPQVISPKRGFWKRNK